MTSLHALAGTVLLIIGAALVAAGLRRSIRGGGPRHPQLSRALSLIQGLRLAILGLCTAGAGAGFLWNIKGLAMLAAIIALQELRETTFLMDVVAAQVRGEEAVRWFGMARVPPPMRLSLPRLARRRT